MSRYWIFIGAILAAMAVGLGAYHAHGLESLLADKYSEDAGLFAKRMGNWGTAAQYQIYHSIGLVLVGLIAQIRPGKWLTIAGWCFVAGIILFSGLLYVLAITNLTKLGMIVPLGGLSMMAGWVALAIGGCCLQPNRTIVINESSQ